jgi:hypothetical protein
MPFLQSPQWITLLAPTVSALLSWYLWYHVSRFLSGNDLHHCLAHAAIRPYISAHGKCTSLVIKMGRSCSGVGSSEICSYHFYYSRLALFSSTIQIRQVMLSVDDTNILTRATRVTLTIRNLRRRIQYRRRHVSVNRVSELRSQMKTSAYTVPPFAMATRARHLYYVMVIKKIARFNDVYLRRALQTAARHRGPRPRAHASTVRTTTCQGRQRQRNGASSADGTGSCITGTRIVPLLASPRGMLYMVLDKPE